ncbi:MAG: hypothetical protein LBS99_00570 [Clostridiales bacterium]|jgi:ABC-type sugar transport system permease subunit|nr:hypothetical protein [Clostridiales bacterium]
MKKLTGRQKTKIKSAAFYVSLVGLPVLQFCIFYIGVNLNSILLAFKAYDMGAGEYVFYGLNNFTKVFRDFGTLAYLGSAIKNSLILYGVSILVALFSTFFSFYIYKKRLLGGLFRFILFLPHIVSALVFSLIFMYFTDEVIPFFADNLFHTAMEGLISNPKTQLGAVLFFTFWTGFSTQVLMFSSSMSGISDSVIEAGIMDGVTPLKEFFYIVVPMVWSTLCTFLVVGVATIFTAQMNLFSFFGTSAEYGVYTFGYYLYRAAKLAGVSDYPYLSATGLVLTAVAIPLSFLARFALGKVGPHAD